ATARVRETRARGGGPRRHWERGPTCLPVRRSACTARRMTAVTLRFWTLAWAATFSSSGRGSCSRTVRRVAAMAEVLVSVINRQWQSPRRNACRPQTPGRSSGGMAKTGRVYVNQSVSFPPALLEAAKKRARSLGLGFSTYVRKCLEQDLRE